MLRKYKLYVIKHKETLLVEEVAADKETADAVVVNLLDVRPKCRVPTL